MVRIQKEGGKLEEFSKAKLEQSIKLTGASAEVAKKVADRVKPAEGMPTADLRRTVAKELKREDSTLSSAYASTKRLSAKMNAELSPGVARIPEGMLRSLDLKSGHAARLSFGGKSVEVKVEKAQATHRSILLSEADLKKLGASEGVKIGLHFEKR
jgi:uncharacterized protein with von Willebrand factor type A (vWA) domain